MRPIELTVRGFRSYRDEVTFDFRDRRLVGVVGPIGSGKSSLLDAIAFALYGKTPTFERDTKSLIHQLADGCHVELRFEVGDQTWRVVRSLRAGRGASGHQLEHLSEDGPKAERLDVVTGERAVRERVERLLGLDFDAFRRSVLLAQNRFADFLQAGEADRNAVLKGVFGYERFDRARDIAKRLAAEASVRVEGLTREGDVVRDARERLADARSRSQLAIAAVERVDSAREAAEAQLVARHGAEEAARLANVELEVLDRASEALPDEGSIAGALAAVERAGRDLERASAERADAVAAHERAVAAYAAVLERVGDRSEFATLVARFDQLALAASAAQERLTQTRAHADAAARVERVTTAEVEASSAASEAARQRMGEEDTALAAAEEALHAARHGDMARTLAAGLSIGDPCPVCERSIDTIPDRTPAVDLASAEATLGAVRHRHRDARTTLEKATSDVAVLTERSTVAAQRMISADEQMAAATSALAEADAQHAAARSELVDRLGEGDPHALVAARDAELIEAERTREDAVSALDASRAVHETAREVDERAKTELARFTTRLAAVWGLLGEPRDVAATSQALIEGADDVRNEIRSRRDRAETAHAGAVSDVRTASDELERILGELGTDPEADLTRLVAEASAERAATDREVKEIESTLTQADDLDERLDRAERARDLATRLANDLQPSRFLVFLLAEERSALAELGSYHLEQLTGGAYRFTDDARFDVIDVNAAGTSRRAQSLSGGETFLASLALALALAEMVSRGGGRLDAFFLDEGFGSLDPDHLDRAMQGVERLVEGDDQRLVVLVSHVAEMREAIEDLIILDKDERTGDTIVRSGAALA